MKQPMSEKRTAG